MVNRQAVMGGADESVEWQPAIIRPQETHPNFRPSRLSLGGRRILIQPTPWRCEICGGCGCRIYEPMAREIDPTWGDLGFPAICESQILTD